MYADGRTVQGLDATFLAEFRDRHADASQVVSGGASRPNTRTHWPLTERPLEELPHGRRGDCQASPAVVLRLDLVDDSLGGTGYEFMVHTLNVSRGVMLSTFVIDLHANSLQPLEVRGDLST